MNIHEYQAKGLLKKYGVTVPRGGIAYTPAEAEAVARDLGGPVWVVKSQIHAGGRGAGRFKDHPDGKGGVRVVKSIEDVGLNATEMLGHVLITKQTGPTGKEVKRIYIEEGCDIRRELYLGLLLDRKTGRVTVIASTPPPAFPAFMPAKSPSGWGWKASRSAPRPNSSWPPTRRSSISTPRSSRSTRWW
jgi:succinyl-CoA synthetase beta subunit